MIDEIKKSGIKSLSSVSVVPSMRVETSTQSPSFRESKNL